MFAHPIALDSRISRGSRVSVLTCLDCSASIAVSLPGPRVIALTALLHESHECLDLDEAPGASLTAVGA